MKKITKIDELPQGQLPNTKLRVAAYARVSTDSDEQLESLKALKHSVNTMSAILSLIQNGCLLVFIMTKGSPAPRWRNGLNCSA